MAEVGYLIARASPLHLGALIDTGGRGYNPDRAKKRPDGPEDPPGQRTAVAAAGHPRAAILRARPSLDNLTTADKSGKCAAAIFAPGPILLSGRQWQGFVFSPSRKSRGVCGGKDGGTLPFGREQRMQRRTAVPWPVRSEHHAHMRLRQQQNQGKCQLSKAETWMQAKLAATGRKWRRQAQSGFRLFDFWNHQLGIAIEVDGPEHDSDKDACYDATVYTQRGIVVLRVRNFNEADADEALRAIAISESWNARRLANGLKPVLGAD